MNGKDDIIPIFGQKDDSVTYRPRPGAYGILLNPDGLVAVIFTNNAYFLPGGGQEPGESIRACLERELLEELGCVFKAAGLIGRAEEYIRSLLDGVYYLCHGYFFLITDSRLVAAPTDKTHDVVWLEPLQALNCLHHESQRWALKRALGRKEGTEKRC